VALDPLGKALAGETLHAARGGAPLQLKLIVALKPGVAVRLRLYLAAWPAVTVAVVDEPDAAASAKSRPVPVRATVWGLPAALSENERVPAACPPEVGVKSRATVQLELGPTVPEAVHVVPEVTVANGPVTATADSERVALPVLERVTIWELVVVPTKVEPKLTLQGEAITESPVPVPSRGTVSS
jgi:hypothetical protein